jgi:diamine N-acetyltransferase
MKEYSLETPAITLRATRNAALDYVLAAEDSPDNQPFIIPWTREQHIRALGDSNCAHLIVGAESSVGYVIWLRSWQPLEINRHDVRVPDRSARFA